MFFLEIECVGYTVGEICVGGIGVKACGGIGVKISDCELMFDN